MSKGFVYVVNSVGMRRLTLWVFLSCVLLAGTLLAQEVPVKTGPLSNKDVVEMLKAGLTPEIVIAKIGSSKCDFDTAPATLKELKIANVPDTVILAMVKAAQRAKDDLEDCRTRSQNEYEAKMNAIGTMALAPMTRVVASNKLKQNLDAELRQCRSQYELRLKAIDAK